MQAYRTFSQMDAVVERVKQRIEATTWPWVRGIPDEPKPGAMTWETPYNYSIIKAEDKREASFIASQTLHYLRSALDHLIYNASWFDQGVPQKGTQFPIYDQREKWSKKNGSAKQLGGMSAQHAAVIEAVQPFNGNQWTQDLQFLSNADKHRLGIEVSPTLQYKVNIGDAIEDPNSPEGRLAQIDEISLRMLLPPLANRELSDVFDAMFAGVIDTINPFLVEQKLETIKLWPRA